MKTKKELKAAYKEMKPIAGLFQVENTQNGMVLIEGAADMQSKWNRHQTELKFGSHRNKNCLLYTSPSPRDLSTSRMPSSA